MKHICSGMDAIAIGIDVDVLGVNRAGEKKEERQNDRTGTECG